MVFNYQEFYDFQKIFQLLGSGLGNVLFPPRCLSCDKPVSREPSVCARCWVQLNFITHPHCHICGSISVVPAGNPRTIKCLRCESGKGRESVYCRSALVHNDVLKNILYNFKFNHRTSAKALFARWIHGAVGRDIWKDVDLIIPTPLHVSKIRRRGFNQSLLMCHELQKITGIRCLPNVLLRHKNTQNQGPLNFAQRRENVRDAFSINEDMRHLIKGRTVAIVDDLYTTGATLQSCARSLRRCNPRRIYGMTVARTMTEG